jgi:hypothetical protein
MVNIIWIGRDRRDLIGAHYFSTTCLIVVGTVEAKVAEA